MADNAIFSYAVQWLKGTDRANPDHWLTFYGGDAFDTQRAGEAYYARLIKEYPERTIRLVRYEHTPSVVALYDAPEPYRILSKNRNGQYEDVHRTFPTYEKAWAALIMDIEAMGTAYAKNLPFKIVREEVSNGS